MTAVEHFNPRTLRGVRLLLDYFDQANHKFQSTHPTRGATQFHFAE